jgi:hypothetical protein
VSITRRRPVAPLNGVVEALFGTSTPAVRAAVAAPRDRIKRCMSELLE